MSQGSTDREGRSAGGDIRRSGVNVGGGGGPTSSLVVERRTT